MTTSGVITSVATAADFVRLAMDELGLISAGEQPTPEETNTGVERLNWMLKTWQAKGVNLWREETTTVTAPAATRSFVLPAAVREVQDMRFVESASYERQLTRWQRAEYMSMPNKDAIGNPTIYYIEKAVSGVTCYVWPVPSADSTLALDYGRIIQDVTAPDQTLDVPQEWTETIYLCLAARLTSMFGVNRIDPNTAADVKQRAAEAELLLLDQDRPTSIFFGPTYQRIWR